MIVACLCTGNTFYNKDYVENLRIAVSRRTKYDYTFLCIKESTYPRWWGKLEFFKEQDDRMIILDLDILLTGSIDFLFEYPGDFAARADWNGRSLHGSVYVVSPEAGRLINKHFKPEHMAQFYSDQEYLTSLFPSYDRLPEEKIGSYKYDSLEAGPRDYNIVCLHGHPKPHELSGWVEKSWKNKD